MLWFPSPPGAMQTHGPSNQVYSSILSAVSGHRLWGIEIPQTVEGQLLGSELREFVDWNGTSGPEVHAGYRKMLRGMCKGEVMPSRCSSGDSAASRCWLVHIDHPAHLNFSHSAKGLNIIPALGCLIL